MSAPGAQPASAASSRAQGVVRRVIVFVILFALVTVAAIGLSGLVERAIGGTITLAGGTAALAQSLAFTFIGAPLAGLLWWWERRRLLDSDDRASLAWSLYLAAMSTTALVTATVALGSAAAAGIEGTWRPGSLATGVVWAGVWLWHRSLRRGARLSPARLPDLSAILGWVYGVGVFATGAIAALAALVGEALALVAVPLASSQQWWVPLLQSLVWTALGGLVWWWHWRREGARTAPGAFAGVALVIVVGAAAAVTLFAIGTVLFVPAAVAYTGVRADPELGRRLVPPSMVTRAEEARARLEAGEPYVDVPQVQMSVFSSTIMTNNIGVSLTACASGMLAGLGPVYLMLFNGLLIGVIGSACYRAGMSAALWSFVTPHGVLELPAIFIAGGAGLLLARGILIPGMLPRRDAIADAGRDAGRLMLGVVPILVIAGIVEGFVSPTPTPAAAKFAIGAAIFVLFALYLSRGWRDT